MFVEPNTIKVKIKRGSNQSSFTQEFEVPEQDNQTVLDLVTYIQEYIDHPAYSTIFILGGFYKILSFFFSNFTLSETLNSDNIDQNLQNLFH